MQRIRLFRKSGTFIAEYSGEECDDAHMMFFIASEGI
jgi:hypothetical protein